MRIGSLVKNKENGYIGVVVKKIDNSYLIRWVDWGVYDYYTHCELEVLCK